MIKELIVHMKTYDENRGEVEKAFAKTVKELDSTYVHTSVQYQNLLDEATKKRDAEIAEITEGLLDMVNSAFAAANKKMKDYVIAPVSADLATTLELVRTMGANLTKYEVQIYREKLMTNYTTKRIANPLLDAVTGENHSFMFYDDVKDNLDEVESSVRNWISNYDPTTYSHAILIADQNNSLTECDTLVTSFLNGEV